MWLLTRSPGQQNVLPSSLYCSSYYHHQRHFNLVLTINSSNHWRKCIEIIWQTFICNVFFLTNFVCRIVGSSSNGLALVSYSPFGDIQRERNANYCSLFKSAKNEDSTFVLILCLRHSLDETTVIKVFVKEKIKEFNIVWREDHCFIRTWIPRLAALADLYEIKYLSLFPRTHFWSLT